jgi:release factor glutamine methyltransferase
MASVGEMLQRARALGVDRLDAQLLIGRALGQSRAWMITHHDAALDAAASERVDAQLQRRASGMPLAYLLGDKEFYGLQLEVTSDVLVPRPDTETLVDWALACLHHCPHDAAVVDLGTGSGAIALAIANARPALAVTGVEASGAALEVARRNADRLGVAVQWLLGDWWSALQDRKFDLVVSNPPYVADGDPHLDALRHEPQQALSSGPEGLDALRAIVLGAPGHLNNAAWLLVEHGYEQAGAVQRLLREAGFHDIETRADLAGHARCTGGRWAGEATRGLEAARSPD